MSQVIRPASQKQVDFINRLKDERDLGFVARDRLSRDLLDGLSVPSASYWIDRLLKSPRKATAAPAAPTPVASALEDVEVSKYAIPTYGIQIPGLRFEGDLLFLEVRMFKGTKYLRQLHGSPGGFWRSRFTPAQTVALAAVIRGKHVEYARAFGEHYTCCGRCGAELTDQRSRESFLGPECRKVFGL